MRKVRISPGFSMPNVVEEEGSRGKQSLCCSAKVAELKEVLNLPASPRYYSSHRGLGD